MIFDGYRSFRTVKYIHGFGYYGGEAPNRVALSIDS
jgi:hypothetical protein